MEAILVHGGAWAIPDGMVDAHLSGCHRAAEEGARVLEGGGTAMDAVETAVRVMEEDPTFDAGRGSFLNREGAVEMDAIIMDGRTLRAGSVAAVRNILHPVSLARMVLDRTDHVMLVGEGTNMFAAEMGVEATPEEDLLVGRELERWKALRKDPRFRAKVIFEPPSGRSPLDSPGDTVGAVALDRHGDLAAATSTGGTPKERMGRVGDTPLVGAGAYADNPVGAVSATGWGEPIILSCLSRRVLEFIERGLAPSRAASAALTAAFTTPRMAHSCWRSDGGGVTSRIDQPLMP